MKIAVANIEQTAVCADLMAMQAACFPYDVPTNVLDGMWWIVRDGPLPVGFLGLTFRHQDEPLTAYLALVGVMPEARGLGLQKRLQKVALKKARELGLKAIVTDTYNNPASANSLIACGFRTYMPAVPWKQDGAVYWKKPLP